MKQQMIEEVTLQWDSVPRMQTRVLEHEENGSTVDTEDGNKRNTVIAISVSPEGIEAVGNILKSLPEQAPGIVLVQHDLSMTAREYAQRLHTSCTVEVKEAQTFDRILPGRVLVAPEYCHVRIKKSGAHFMVECFQGEKVNGHCPSADVLFHSVAQHAGKNAVGMMFNATGYDGIKGLRAMQRKGARVIQEGEKILGMGGILDTAQGWGKSEEQSSFARIPVLAYSPVFGS